MAKRFSTLTQVTLAIVLAFIIGGLSKPDSHIFGIQYIQICSFLGQIFLNALMLLVVPLVGSAIINGIAQIGQDKSFARLGGKTFFFYVLTTFLGILTGILFVNLIHPGSYFSLPEQVASSEEFSFINHNNLNNSTDIIGAMLLKLIPNNIFAAASSGNMLGIIFFSFLFGIALAKSSNPFSDMLVKLWNALFFTLMRMTQYIIKIVPFGVFFLVTHVIAQHRIRSIGPLLIFLFTVILALASFMFGILPLLLKLVGIHPWHHLKAMLPALITAFSTSSSAATLPVTIDCVEKKAGVSNRICSFVVPLGTSINMSGSALYECVAVLFIAQIYGIELTIIHQVLVVTLALITSMGVAGIPSASLIAILIILNMLNFPAEGIALILPVDRLLDMCRTTVNVFSDSSCAVIIAHTEGEKLFTTKP